MRAHELRRSGLHGRQVQRRGDPVAVFHREGVVDARIEDVVAVGLGVGGVTGVESRRDRLHGQGADVRRQMRVEGGHQLFRRDLPIVTETQRETPRMDAGIGAGAALYIGAAAQRRLHGVLQGRADRGGVGLHLEPRVAGAFVGDPQKPGHPSHPGTKNRVATMTASASASTTAQRASEAVNRSCLRRVRPSPPW